MLSLPMPATDELKLADWLELYALISPDKNASYIDLERALRREGVFGLDSDEDIERKIGDVSFELEQRALSATRAYPFDVSARAISLRATIEDFAPYIFCLCLSFFGTDQKLNRRPFPRRMFEYLSCEAAKNFLGGDVIRFASPRQPPDLPREFDRAVNELCQRIREGGGFRKKRAFSAKDDAVDIVAWRDFPDQADGRLLLFGNCASGNDWDSKLDELQPLFFCEDWMVEVPVSIHFGIRAFFVPRRLPSTDWQRVSRRAGMIFDRCRIAYWVSENHQVDERQYLDWIRPILARATR